MHPHLLITCFASAPCPLPCCACSQADLATGAATTLVSGSDFYASPRLSPDGSRLAWVSWDHPNMPWDDTTLWVGEVDAAGAMANPRKVGGEQRCRE